MALINCTTELSVSMICDSSTDSPRFMVADHNKGFFSLHFYDSLYDLIQDYPLDKYRICVDAIETTKVIGETVSLMLT